MKSNTLTYNREERPFAMHQYKTFATGLIKIAVIPALIIMAVKNKS